MGLDQCVNKVNREEVKYWRKHYELQEWFEENYGQQNCVPTRLTVAILEHIIADVKNGKLSLDEDDLRFFEEILEDTKEYENDYEYDCWY
jgi:hypothetical protein